MTSNMADVNAGGPGMSSDAASHLYPPQDPGGSRGGGGYGPMPVALGSLADKLRVAASKGQLDKVQDLLQAGAGFEPDRDGRTALHYAAQNGYVDVCKLLIEKGCELNVQDAMGYTALLRASSQGLLDVVRVCLEAGCAVDFADEHGNTALHEATWHGFSKTVELLIKYNANVFRTNKSGFTALHLGAQNGHNESSRVLLYGGINPDLQNNYGDTALHTAARYGHAGVTRILISAKCKLNVPNKNGDTALHIAAALKRRKIAKILVESHVDTHLKNKQNETAIDVARRKEHPEIILIITSLSRPHSAGPKPREVPGVTFKDDIEIDDGPVVCADDEPPVKPEKQEKERRFFPFFKKKKKDKDKEKEKFSQSTGTQAKRPIPPGKVQPIPAKPVAGFFSQYVPRTGTQYYRDLAGNIKQGPVGYTPVCQCGPALHHLEKSMHQTKEQLYEHIDASHQVLQDRIEQLNLRTSQQAHSLDHLTRERLEAERRACQEALDQRLKQERQHTQYVVESYGEGLQGQIQGWLEDRLASYGHCLDHHHDDSALPPRHIFSDVHLGPDGGRLFRSRSDETLSVSDCSGKGRKRQFYESRKAAMEQIRGWKVPTGTKDSSRRRERGRSADDLDGRRERGSSNNNNNSSGNNRNQGVGGSTGNMVTMAEVHKAAHDRMADGASPKCEGEGAASRQQQQQQEPQAGGHGASGRQTPAYGAVPKRSIHFYPQTQPHAHSHLQAQSFQARSHGNLSSRPAANPPGASPAQPSQYPAGGLPPPRGILRSGRTDDGALHERARSSSTTRLQPNLDERGPLGESSFGPNPGGRGGPCAVDPASTGRAGKAASSAGPQRGPSYVSAAQSLLDPARRNGVSAGAVDHGGDSPPRYPRSRTRSTDALSDGADGFSGGRFRSRSEERVLDHEEGGQRPRAPPGVPGGDQSGYVTDSGMRKGYAEHSLRNYSPYRPVSHAQARTSTYWSNANARAELETRNTGRFVPNDRTENATRTPSGGPGYSGNAHRPVSSERNSGYFTDSDVKRAAQGQTMQPANSSPYGASPAQQRQQEQQQPAHQPTTRYRVLPPLPPGSAPTGDRAYPHIAPKPAATQSSSGGNSGAHERARSHTPTARDNASGSNVIGGRSGTPGGAGGFGAGGATGSDGGSARRPSETAAAYPSYSYRGFSPRPGSGGAQLQLDKPASPGSRQTPESPRELWENSRQMAKDKAGYSHVSNAPPPSQLLSRTARTPSPYQQAQPGSGRNSVSKSESNLASKDSLDGSSPREPQPVSSGHYSVSNGCLRHDSYSSYSPAYNGGSKEDSTCSSNQDSGYSSRMVSGSTQGKGYGSGSGGGGGGRSAESGTPSSSFSTDRSVSLGPPSNASSPYMHMGGNSYGEYVLMGGNSAADTESPRPVNPYRGYGQSNGGGGVQPPVEYQNVGFRNGCDYPAMNAPPAAQQQPRSGTTPGSQSGAVGANIQKQVQGWYQQKLLEAAERLRNSEQYGQADNSYGSYSTVPIHYDPVHGSDV